MGILQATLLLWGIGRLRDKLPQIQGRPKPCFCKPRFSREFLHPLHCAPRTHSGSKTAWFPRALSLLGEGLQRCLCRSCSELQGLNNRVWKTVLQSWRPATEVPKPRPDKSAEKVLRKVPAPNGVPRKAPKKSASAFEPLYWVCRSSNETRRLKHFFGTFLGTPFAAGTFRSTFRSTFVGTGLRHFCSWSPRL